MHVPPPVLVLGALAGQRVLAGERRGGAVMAGLAAATAGAAVVVAAAGSREFYRHGTTVDPVHPDRASTLVTSGPFRFTRNPMYLGMTGLLVAHAVWRGRPVAVLPAAAFVVYLDRFQIPPEEEALTANFGEDYDDYRSSVPRWLGPPSQRRR
ncbi:methyltransferase family protein [Nocardioides insulae]|uniref:methyltransferase family protein n=1 Tax=Nocardioides insulae TaxID=394734 RepID=UPI000411FA92|nr:isoprenylcysteine carboxylmethyltransferase family protein [Nocardioides insulae]